MTNERPASEAVCCAAATDRRPVVLIPAYKPDLTLVRLVRELLASSDFQHVVIVDDGSGTAYSSIFRELASLTGVHVITHIVNLGKGAALKTGLNHAACAFQNAAGIVTADADGQHRLRDIRAVGAALAGNPKDLVLGTRQFDGKVPFRSRLGNTITRHALTLIAGQRLADTQSGLRGIPIDFVPELVRLRSTGYDFELDMLITSKRAARHINQVTISTIYTDGNRSSHFNPLLDSMRIYFVFLRFSAVSFATAIIDNFVFIAIWQFLPQLLLCQAIARFTAGMFNYYAAKTGVFHSSALNKSALPKYWLLVVASGLLSYTLIDRMVSSLSVGVIPAKLCVEALLFGVSFIAQREFVFRTKGDSR